MAIPLVTGSAFNRTRQVALADRLSVADGHWSRFCGLMGLNASQFVAGQGLWILPCHGVHSFFMHFAIDVVYLDRDRRVIHLAALRPWRFAPVRRRAVSVVELPEGTIDSSGTQLGDIIDITRGEGSHHATRLGGPAR